MGKPRKKYRPKPVRIMPVIADVVLGDLSDGEREFLREAAMQSLDLVQLGTEDIGDYANIDAVLRNLWVYALQFEETAIVRVLTLMASSCLSGLYAGAGDALAARRPGTAVRKPLTHEDRVALVRPIQAAIDMYFELTKTAERRSELVCSQYAAGKIRLPRVHEFYLVDKSSTSKADQKAFWHRRGVAFVNGRAVPGYYKTDNLGRLIWRIPLEQTQVAITDPTPTYFINDERLSDAEEEA
nr:MAG TPA: hypothetical protein [Caudoviricetes sp.]